jgi:hypothetical protein
MALWGWVLLIACLSVLLFAAVFAIVQHTHRRMPERQVVILNPAPTAMSLSIILRFS